ncbi:hypothetical protein GC176_01050 [bacterium]|nr:hypothetical protein [bacterium]
MKRMLASLLLVCVMSDCVRSAEPLSQALLKPIEVAPSQVAEELVAVPLDSEVYTVAADDLSDLRIVSGERQTVPFLLRKRQTTELRTTRRNWPAGELTARPVEEDRFEIRVSLGKDDPQPTHLRLVTPLSDFEQQVDVYSVSEDSTEPKLLVEGELIFDYSAVVDVRRDTVELPKNSARHFRIDVRAMTDDVESPYLNLTRNLQGKEEVSRQERTLIRRRPFRINRIEWIREESHQRVKDVVAVDWPTKMAATTLDEKLSRTVIEITTQRQPISSFVVETGSSNFSRSVVVEVPDTSPGRSDWKQIGDGTIHRFSFRDLDEEKLKVEFPETRSDSFRLIIENRDSPPLEISTVTARGPVHEAVFLTQPSQSCSLLYDADTEAPDYDLAALNRLLGEGVEPVAAQLGPQQAFSAADGKSLNIKAVLNNPYILGGVAGVLIVLFGWALYSAGKRIGPAEGE